MSNKNIDMMLSLILGDKNTKDNKNLHKTYDRVNKQLILSSAMFWDSKKRIQKIKTLFLNALNLKQFDDNQDFKVQDLENIELLSIKKNQIIHLHPLSNLHTLISLNISFNKVYDLNPLSQLPNLQQLYASNNEIKTIECLKDVKSLKILQFYMNKIHHFKQTFQTIKCLENLLQIDLEQNPVSQDKQFLSLLSQNFRNLKKINGQLNKSTQKIKQMSSSKSFMNMSIKGFNNTSILFNSNSQKTNDSQSTIYDFCKKKSSNSKAYEKRKQKQNILKKLQNHYEQLDEQFQKQIVKNVRLKNRLYKIIQNNKNLQNQKQQKSEKIQQIKLLKRKVKAMKQQLFAKDRKGQLLKKLFEVQMSVKNTNQEDQSSCLNNQKQNKMLQFNNTERAKRQIMWTRRFQADQVIVIQRKQKYPQNEDEEIDQMLGNIENSIVQLKSQLDYLS